MFYRKISKVINEYLDDDEVKILCIDGARQVGKSFIIRELAKKKYKNYIELNMADDFIREKRFEKIANIDQFYLQVSITHGQLMGDKTDTIIFLDEIQIYPELLTLLKPLFKDNRYKYICSGSELGIALSKTTLIPAGSFREVKMYPMDFEEFLLANSVGDLVIKHLKDSFLERKTLEPKIHDRILELFKSYLYVGGMPEVVKAFVETKNVYKIKMAQQDIISTYEDDASKYDKRNKLKIRKIYDLVPSNLESKVKRIQFSKIENIDDARFLKYEQEFEYLISSGITLDVKAISEPKFPLIQSSSKNLIKLYMNDVGLLTYKLYKTQINAILDEKSGVNLGAVYETAAAQELRAHGHELYYYDRKKVGKVDFLIDDNENMSIVPIEIKSGTDNRNFKALPKIINDQNYRVNNAYVFSNEREISIEDKIIFMPIYYLMFI